MWNQVKGSEYFSNALYRREIPRCGKFQGEHGTEDCIVLVEIVLFVNCKGTHIAGDLKSPVRDKQFEVTRVRVVQKVLYAEAVKKVQERG
jgi:hypothetical protein